jgi:hypothetical protein
MKRTRDHLVNYQHTLSIDDRTHLGPKYICAEKYGTGKTVVYQLSHVKSGMVNYRA